MIKKLKELLTDNPQDALFRGLVIMIIWIVLISMILVLPNNIGNFSNISKMGPFGDAFNGLITPVIAGVTALLTYAAFYMQFQANKTQRDALEEQKLESRIIQFENKFFELLKIHRANVSQMIYKGAKGRSVFVSFVIEFDKINKEYVEICADTLNINLTPKEKINLTYLILFYGEGKKSTPILKELLKSYNSILVDNVLDRIQDYKTNIREKNIKLKEENKPLTFLNFGGQQSRLSHYFRHLYHTIKFIEDEMNDIYKHEIQNNKLTNTELLKIKSKYTKILRGQLSNHEQILLFYNSLSQIGRSWKREGLISKYGLIKNIPKGFIKIIDPKSEYGDIIFEYEEEL